MRNLIMQLELTLDGFYAGPNEEFDWFTLDAEAWQRAVADYEDKIDTILLGRKNYQGFYGYWPSRANDPEASETDVTFVRWLGATPKVVFSRTLESADWENARLVKDDLPAEVSRLKAQPGKDILIMSSTSVAQACMKADLIDEYWLTVHPVALGRGLPLFVERVGLTLVETRVFGSGQVLLRYTAGIR